MNNPLAYTDPSGYQTTSHCDGRIHCEQVGEQIDAERVSQALTNAQNNQSQSNGSESSGSSSNNRNTSTNGDTTALNGQGDIATNDAGTNNDASLIGNNNLDDGFVNVVFGINFNVEGLLNDIDQALGLLSEPVFENGNPIPKGLCNAESCFDVTDGLQASDGLVLLAAIPGILGKNNPKPIRVRHFTDNKGIKGIREESVIRASDQNSVFTERARGKPGSARDVEARLGIKQNKGNNFVEFDALPSEFEIIKNPSTGATERVFKGNVSLEGRNATFHKNR
jgi:hypothetical protein